MRGLWPQPDTLRPLAYDFFRFLKRPQLHVAADIADAQALHTNHLHDLQLELRVECPSFSLAHIPRPGGLHLSRCPGKLDQHNRQRNEVERLFRRIKAYRRVFTRYDKLDVVYVTFVSMALICEHLR